MPVRPPAQPYWMNILQLSAQTTEAAFDRIDRNLERSRRARQESEEYKFNVLTQMENYERDDRDFALKERELNFRIEEAGRDNLFKQATHDLYRRRQSLDEIQARTDLMVNQYLKPIDDEIKRLEALPGTEDKISELRKRRDGAVAPLLSEIQSLSTSAPGLDPAIREQAINDSVTRSLLIADKALIGENDIDASLFPDDLVGEINQSFVSEYGESPIGEITQRKDMESFLKHYESKDPNANNPKGEPTGIPQGFDFGTDVRPNEPTPSPKSYPTTQQSRTSNQPLSGKGASGSISFGGYQSGSFDFSKGDGQDAAQPQQQQQITPEIISQHEAYINGIRDRAIANKTYDPSKESIYVQYLDEKVGKENNPLRAQARNGLRAAIISDVDVETRGAALKKAQLILGHSETESIISKSMTDKALLGEQEAKAKMQRELDLHEQKLLIEKRVEGGVQERDPIDVEIEKARKELDEIKSLLSDPDSNRNNLGDATISAIKESEADAARRLADLIIRKRRGNAPEPDPFTVVAPSGSTASASSEDPEIRLSEDALSFEIGAALDAPIGLIASDLIKRSAIPVLGLEEDDFKYIEKHLEGIDENDASDISRAVRKGLRDKYAEEWENLSEEKKRLFSKSEKVRKEIASGAAIESAFSFDPITYKSFDKEGSFVSNTPSLKDIFITLKMQKKDTGSKLNNFEARVSRAMRERNERNFEDIID